MLVNIVVNKISLVEEVVKYSFFYSERTFFDMYIFLYMKCILCGSTSLFD